MLRQPLFGSKTIYRPSSKILQDSRRETRIQPPAPRITECTGRGRPVDPLFLFAGARGWALGQSGRSGLLSSGGWRRSDDKKIRRTAADVQTRCCDGDDEMFLCCGCDENLEKQNTCPENVFDQSDRSQYRLEVKVPSRGPTIKMENRRSQA